MRNSILVGTLVLWGCLVSGLLLEWGSTLQAQSNDPFKPGRFQIALSDAQGSSQRVVICDTGTGEVWSYTSGTAKWVGLGSPLARSTKEPAK